MEFLGEVDPCGTGTSRRAFLAGSAALAGSTVLPAVGQELAQEPAQSGRAGLAHSSTGMVTSRMDWPARRGLRY